MVSKIPSAATAPGGVFGLKRAARIVKTDKSSSLILLLHPDLLLIHEIFSAISTWYLNGISHSFEYFHEEVEDEVRVQVQEEEED